ncbi:CDP-glycerol glycerophosphotransferase family protein [Vibrio breoganii]
MTLNYIRKLFIQVFQIPIYYIFGFGCRNKNIWLFGAWKGHILSDNPKYLFDYVRKNTGIEAVWITKNRTLSNPEGGIYYAYSFQGILYCIKASKGFVTHGADDLVPCFIRGISLINLTHGSPVKKIANDVSFNRLGALTPIFDKIKHLIIPSEARFDYIVCANKRDNEIFRSAYKIKKDVYTLGYPRWVALNDSQLKFGNFEKIVLYAPTLRYMNKVELKPFDFDGFDSFVEYLEKNNQLLIIRPHPVMKLDYSKLGSNNIIVLDSSKVEDINTLLSSIDVLVSDYSSIIYDFAIINENIILLSPDSEDYINNDVGVYGDYYKDTPGKYVRSWTEVRDIVSKTDRVDRNPLDAFSASEKIYNKFKGL